ncbi:nicotinate-nucleotide adenylyltransferase [Gilvimarinus xylanilyticus]|uniref:Probable nicotinate-nucleotide adenylyltransferase n=1 Tax=Gilvimarinus xylanilyticus TaxID=2944139 RepID=A0A9X2I4Q1_9GAMM|nr:nicotinate-nucleotide adenylyltransferase [Gilvimarinus xylanilyticus]MCP8899407.1 nicotinate-nucleotide adenylyltransferase [Gilvimarinus xylanilyticus]
MRRKIAVFGGTFNPIHHGHLRLALDLVQQVSFDQMRLVPCHIPMHREDPSVASRRRARMVELAIAGSPTLTLDTCELERGSASYSVDTLAQLRAEQGGEASISLIMGLDAYLGLMRWHRWEELLQLGHLVVVDRPGYQMPKSGPLADFDREHGAATKVLEQASHGFVVHLDIRALDISATEIRTLTAQGLSTRYLLPEAVRHYIAERGLYGAGDPVDKTY